MIDIMFDKLGDKALVRVNNKKLLFAKVVGGHLLWSNIDGLRFGVSGVLKEFPDLKDKSNQEIIDIGKQRFQNYIQQLNSEEDIKKYIMKDLGLHGYKALYIQRKGFRPERCH